MSPLHCPNCLATWRPTDNGRSAYCGQNLLVAFPEDPQSPISDVDNNTEPAIAQASPTAAIDDAVERRLEELRAQPF